MPTSTGCSAEVSQRQLPLSVFWNANDFSIFNRCATGKLSRPPGGGLALPDFGSQQVPVQFAATGLQTEKGERTTISTSAITWASCGDILESIWETRLTRRKS